MYCPGCGEEIRYSTLFCDYCDTPVSTSIVETAIEGSFTGWSGETVFTLSNGESWRQASAGEVACNLTSPRVWLYPSGVGHELRIEGLGDRVGVTKLVVDETAATTDA